MTKSQSLITPVAVLRLDGGRFRRELAIRAVTARDVSRVSGVAPNTLTRCLHGAPISVGTLRAVVKALQSMPVLQGVDELIATETRNAAALGTAAFVEEGAHDTDPRG